MRNIQKIVETKSGSKWEVTYTCTDEKEVYDSLAHDLIAKKINACTYIRSIKRNNNYDGTQNITISYDNNVRAVYTVSEH